MSYGRLPFKRGKARLSLALVLFGALVAGRSPVTANPAIIQASFAVTTTTDAVDASPGNGQCAIAGGGCTLRAAIQESNALGGSNTITLPAGTYMLSIGGA